jgi:type IV pilus assembly protein PilC
MGTMLDAGLGVRKALGIAIRNSSGRMRKALIKVHADIEDGRTLSEAMSDICIFPKDDICIIEAGEISGRLNVAFISAAAWHEWRTRSFNAIRNKMIVPLLQMHAAAFILPFPSYFLGHVTLTGYLVAVFSLLLLIYIPIGVMLVVYWMSGTQGPARRFTDRLLLRVPFLGMTLYDIALMRYCGSFHALLEAGVPMPVCAEISVGLCGNAEVASMLKGGADSARAGNPVSEGFSDKLPSKFLSMWRTGEQTGRLSEILQLLSAEKQGNTKLQSKSTSAE